MSNDILYGKGPDGTGVPLNVGSDGALTVSDLFFSIAAGQGVDNTSSISKFGFNSDIDTGTVPEDIWSRGGVYVPPTAARTHQLVSSSIQDAGTVVSSGTTTSAGDQYTLIDTAATFQADGVAIGDAVLNDTAFDHSVVASIDSETQITVVSYHDALNLNTGDAYRVVTDNGTGTAVMHIKNGLSAAGAFQGEFIVMNGTTNVPTTKTYMRLNRMHNDLTGSANTNVGTITATADTDATVTAEVPIGSGSTEMAHFTVPKGKTAFITGYYMSIGRAGNPSGAMLDVNLMVDKFAPVNSVGPILEHTLSCAVAGSSYIYHKFQIPSRQKELTDIFLRVSGTSDSNSYIAGGFDIVMLDNT